MLRRTPEKNGERTISGLGPIFFPPKLQEVALDLVRKMFFREALPLFLLTIRSTRPVDSLSTFHPAGSPVTYHDLSTDVVWACTIPDKGGQNVVEPLPSALHRLWPARFASPTAARKACRRREIFVQNVCLGSCSTLVFPGDVVEQRQRSAPDLPVKSARGIAAAATAALPVLYEDDDIAVVVKPRGMSVHNSPSQSTREGKAGRGVSSPGTLEPEDHITVRSALPHVLVMRILFKVPSFRILIMAWPVTSSSVSA